MTERFMIKAFISGKYYYVSNGYANVVVWAEDKNDATLFGTEEAVEQFAFLNLKKRQYRYEILPV